MSEKKKGTENEIGKTVRAAFCGGNAGGLRLRGRSLAERPGRQLAGVRHVGDDNGSHDNNDNNSSRAGGYLFGGNAELRSG